RRTRSQSCPFCRDSLKRVNSGDLWVFTDRRDVVDMATVTRENLRRLFMYIDKLPVIVPDSLFDTYDSHIRVAVLASHFYQKYPALVIVGWW
ncbi:RING finger protein, partial [Trifolium pratense]